MVKLFYQEKVSWNDNLKE